MSEISLLEFVAKWSLAEWENESNVREPAAIALREMDLSPEAVNQINQLLSSNSRSKVTPHDPLTF